MNKTMSMLVARGLVVLVLLTLNGCSNEFNDISAYACAQNAVKNRLKSPSTAKFCSYTDAKITLSGNIYTVSGYVDAQNGFGATIRSKFTVKLTEESIISVTIS